MLEICAFNIQSCLVAEKAGAGRIELCADPTYGGTTPSYGTIQYALEQLSIPVFPMIRPRGGNFAYDAHEVAIMKKDILTCRTLGCTGIATGVLLPTGQVDEDVMKRIVEWAYPMVVTCHKAFDRTTDAFSSMEALINAGCARILTSGLRSTATEGAALLAELIARAAGRIIIMPGGGVRSENIAGLINTTRATEYHSSGLLRKDGSFIADESEIRLMAEIVKAR